MRPSKFNAALSAFCGSFCFASTALAADPAPYVEIGASWTDPDFVENHQHLSGLVRGGIELTSWAAIEAEGMLGLNKKETTQSDGDRFKAGLDHQFGGYLRLGIPVNKKVLPYARVGWAKAQTRATLSQTRSGTTTVRESQDSFAGPSFGFGVQGFFGEAAQNGVRLDFTGLISDGDEEEFFDLFEGTSNISVTYVRRF